MQYILGNCEIKIIEAKIRNVKLKSREKEEKELGYNIIKSLEQYQIGASLFKHRNPIKVIEEILLNNSIPWPIYIYIISTNI